MERRIRILRLIARLNIGGPAIQAILLSRELHDENYQTMLVCGSLNPGEGDMTYLAFEQEIQPHVIKTIRRKISLFDDVKSFFAMRRIIKRFDPHIIHTHTAKAGTLGRLAALSLMVSNLSTKKIHIIHTFHGHTFHSYFNRFKTVFFIQVEKVLAKITDKIIVISEQQKIDICNKFKIADAAKVQIVRLGFDLSKFKNIKPRRKNSRQLVGESKNPEPYIVGIIGRITSIKNHSMLLKAMSRLNESGKLPFFRFIVIGDGELKSHLAATADRLHVRDAIVFKGWQKDMPAVYSELDAVVLTSKNEGTPVALIEAMAASRPIVATGIGGVPDLVGNVLENSPDNFQVAERGLVVPSENAAALADALLFLMENSHRMDPMIKRAHEFVFANYTKKKLLNDLKELYNGLINNT